MKWNLFPANPCFDEFRTDWDALNKVRGNHILLDSRFVSALIKHFGSQQTMLAVNNEGPRKGLVLLVKTAMGTWTTFQPSQSPLGMILFGYQDQEHQGLFELMRSLPGFTALLSVLQQDPLNSAFPSVSSDDSVEVMSYIDTPRLQLSGGFEEYWEQRSKNLRHNLDRQNRRMKDQGRTMELVAERDPARVPYCIREYGRLESAGWKGKEGTAINEDNVQGRFYKDVLEDFSRTGEAVTFQLLLDGKVVASDFCLSRDGMLVVLKTTYDEKVDKLSPALLMRKEITRQLFDEKRIRVIEFYGRVRDWHTQWTPETRTMFHVNVFRNRYMRKTRKILKRWR